MKKYSSKDLWLALSFLSCFLLLFPCALTAATLADESGKNWKFKLKAFYAYDDNVVNEPTDELFRPAFLVGKDDHIFEGSASGLIKRSFTNKLSIRADYDIDMTIHSELSQYDLTSQIFGLGTMYKFTPLLNFMLDYKFIYNIVDGDNFGGIQYLSPSFNYMSRKFGLTRVYYTFKYSDNWLNDLRDNDQHSIGFKQYFFFSNYTKRISLGYKYTTDDTTGNSFDRDLHTIELRGKMPLFYGIELDAEVEFTFREYVSRLGTDGSLRDDTQHKFYLQFAKVLMQQYGFMENLTARVKYRYLFNDSNLLIREFRTNRVDIGLEARF